MNRSIDLRSDTVTLPTQDMRNAMAYADVGDDVRKEDQSTNRLEEYVANLLGKERGLFVPSGTMGNLISIMSHTPFRKSEIITESHSHIVTSEAAGYAHIAGVGVRTIDGDHGKIEPEKIKELIRDPLNIHHPITSLICLENTHNASGGTVLGIENMRQINKIAKNNNISMHLDGARLFNAALALNIPAKEITKYFDSASVCLSKGLSAPVGSIIVGNNDFIETAIGMRKILGGGMRQCGVIAAAGYVAVTTMVDRLVEDHETAKIIGEGISELKGILIDLGTVQTNIVRFDISNFGVTADEFVKILATKGLLAGAQGKYKVRFVTHRHINKKDAYETINIMKEVVKEI